MKKPDESRVRRMNAEDEARMAYNKLRMLDDLLTDSTSLTLSSEAVSGLRETICEVAEKVGALLDVLHDESESEHGHESGIAEG